MDVLPRESLGYKAVLSAVAQGNTEMKVIAAAQKDGAALVMFAQMMSDLQETYLA